MNDEFLYQGRVPPRAEFAHRLKAKLDRHAAVSAPRPAFIRTLAAALLLSGVAFAVTSLSRRDFATAFLRLFDTPDRLLTSANDPIAASTAAKDRNTSNEPNSRNSEPSSANRPLPLGKNSALPLTADRMNVNAGVEVSGPDNGALLTPVLTQVAAARAARDYLYIVGSSVVYPFTKRVADGFEQVKRFNTPQIESTGTGSGFRLFCSGVGSGKPDIAAASRRISTVEFSVCARNGVTDLVEVKMGYEAVVLARRRGSEPMALSSRDVYLALTPQIRNPANPASIIWNSNATWRQVNPALPNQTIKIFGPAPGSRLNEVFGEFILEAGCAAEPWIDAIKDIDVGRYWSICHSLREDGAYQAIGQNDAGMLQELEANPGAVGVVSYNFYKANEDKLLGVKLDDMGPSLDAVVTGNYPGSRALYLYVKKAHVGVIPGLREFIAEYLSDRSIGPTGYLVGIGLVPLNDTERAQVRANALALKELKL